MEKDLGKIKKNDFTDIVVRLDDFGGRPGVTIREFVTGERYTGFTKSGVKIQAADLPRFKEMINSITEKDLEVSDADKATQEAKKLPNEQKTLPKNEKGMGKKKEELEKEIEEETEFDDY